MDVLWSKDKLHKIFSKDSLAMTINAHASGDGCLTVRCCRLCSGDTSLRRFNETYLSEGIEERYDQLLYDCFGVRVHPSNCMICEHCIRQLRNINRFRSLVHDAFVKQRSEYSSKHSQMGIGEGYVRPKSKSKVSKDDSKTINRLKEVVKLRKGKSKTIDVPKRREIRRDRRSSDLSNAVVKRIILTCMTCKQRYPMIVPFEGWKEFVCSRCKKKHEVRMGDRFKLKKAPSPSVMKLMKSRLAASKADLRGKSGLSCTLKRSARLSKTKDSLKDRQQKYQCSLCPKKYIVAQHLAHHMSTVHGDRHIEGASRTKDASKDPLEANTRMNTGPPVYQCDVCLRTFKGKRSFQSHYLTHGK